MIKQIRTRFSPSPTGNMHIGNARTAIFNWLLAKSYKGKFILRIENSDLKRSKNKYINNIIESMKWLNIEWDEGPYFQNNKERYTRYKNILKNMLEKKTAYKCYCSRERLKLLKIKQISKGQKPKYDKYCFYKQHEKKTNEPYVVRFCNPLKGKVNFIDQVRGLISFDNEQLDDFIIRRSDGSFTYNFCVVIDDYDMNITHIIRGEEHINNTPRQINIFNSIGAGFNIPKYIHVSTIFNNDGQKISKRLGAKSIIDYRNQGYLPEAIINYLVKLGWSYGNKEIFTVKELKKIFCIEKINKSKCFFDLKKLNWINHHYIKSFSIKNIKKNIILYIKKENFKSLIKHPHISEIIQLFQTRAKTLKEIADFCDLFYKEIQKFDIELSQKYFNKNSQHVLFVIYNTLKNINDNIWGKIVIKNILSSIIKELNIAPNELYMPLRFALTGSEKTPSLSDIIYFLGKNISLKRINYAINYIKS